MPSAAPSHSTPPDAPSTDEKQGGLISLTDEQIRTWTLEQKDRWWLENVYKGDMPQLTLRAALTGMILGGVLSLTNLYIGVKTGWTLGVGITSVILAFAAYKLAAEMRLAKTEFSILENNLMQSVATSAGYMTGPLVSSLAAYMMVTNEVIPAWQAICWMVVLSVLGVLFAFPLKRRFINDEQLPFPEGRAAGVVLDALHSGDPKEGIFKAKLLGVTGGVAAVLAFMKSDSIMTKLKLGFLAVPGYVDGWIYKWIYTPVVLGTPLKDVTVRVESDYVMMAAGGLMGIRTGVSILVGAVINYFVLVPWMIQRGDILGHAGAAGAMTYSFKDITMWALWGGVAMMTTSSLVAFFSKPQVLITAFTGMLGKKKTTTDDPLKDIELPMKVFAIGIPVLGTAAVVMGHFFFGVEWVMGTIAIPLVFIFTLIAVNSTGLTSITPTGALGKLTQLTFGLLSPGNIKTNLMTAGITGEVAGNAANLLMDIKPGYMLGGKPRHQAIGHVLGIFAGAFVAVPVFYLVFLRDNPAGLVTESQPFPGAVVWRAVAEVLTTGLSNLKPSAQMAALIGGVVGIALEILKIASKGRFWLSAVGIGLAFVLPFSTSLAMFLGAFLFWLAGKTFKDESSSGHKIMVRNQETTCAGIIAGGAIAGIAVIILEVVLLA